MKIPLGDFNEKVGRKNIFKPTIENESLHQDSNDNGVRIVNLATSKNLVVRESCSRTETSPDGKTNNQIDHVLIDWRWYSSRDVLSFGETDCLVVANLWKN